MNLTHVYPPPGREHPPGPPPPFPPDSGLCGLSAQEWHGVLIFVLSREHQSTRVRPVLVTLAHSAAVMFVFLIAVVVAWVRTEDVSKMWLQAKDHVGVTRTGT